MKVTSLDETGVRDAIARVEHYIDELARESATIAEYAMPFKTIAADAIRSKVKAATSDAANENNGP